MTSGPVHLHLIDVASRFVVTATAARWSWQIQSCSTTSAVSAVTRHQSRPWCPCSEYSMYVRIERSMYALHSSITHRTLPTLVQRQTNVWFKRHCSALHWPPHTVWALAHRLAMLRIGGLYPSFVLWRRLWRVKGRTDP